jgi:hypothetical protein
MTVRLTTRVDRQRIGRLFVEAVDRPADGEDISCKARQFDIEAGRAGC